MCDRKERRKQHADGNRVPSSSHASNGGLTVWRLARMLVGRLEEPPAVVFGDAGEGHGWKSLKKDRRRARWHGGCRVQRLFGRQAVGALAGVALEGLNGCSHLLPQC